MGYRYPHYETEFLLTVTVALVATALLPLARHLPSWLGIPLVAIPLLLLVVACAVFWFRTRR